jgi:hypothetical protein
MSFRLSFHLALLGLTGAYWLDDPPDLTCQNSTRQHPPDGCCLSCKQQVPGSSPGASSQKSRSAAGQGHQDPRQAQGRGRRRHHRAAAGQPAAAGRGGAGLRGEPAARRLRVLPGRRTLARTRAPQPHSGAHPGAPAAQDGLSGPGDARAAVAALVAQERAGARARLTGRQVAELVGVKERHAQVCSASTAPPTTRPLPATATEATTEDPRSEPHRACPSPLPSACRSTMTWPAADPGHPAARIRRGLHHLAARRVPGGPGRPGHAGAGRRPRPQR